MKKVIVLFFLLISFTLFAGKNNKIKKLNRKPSREACQTTHCQTMDLSLHNLIQSHQNYQRLLQSNQGQLPSGPPTQTERMWNLQMAAIRNFVCDYSFDRATAIEKTHFIQFVGRSFSRMTQSIHKTEVAQCFRGLWDSHQTEITGLIRTSNMTQTFREIHKEGAPIRGEH